MKCTLEWTTAVIHGLQCSRRTDAERLEPSDNIGELSKPGRPSNQSCELETVYVVHADHALVVKTGQDKGHTLSVLTRFEL